jgi:hypothetical protein
MVASIGLVAVNRLSQAGGCSKDSSRQPVSAQATPCLLLTSSPVQATGSRLERPPSYQASTNAVEHLGLIRCAHVPRRLGIDRQLLMDAIGELALLWPVGRQGQSSTDLGASRLAG